MKNGLKHLVFSSLGSAYAHPGKAFLDFFE
jgi:hypothetical protein